MKRIFASFLLATCSLTGWAQTMNVADIRVEGLQRISADIVFASLPVNVGDRIGSAEIANAARSLFATGNFDDIRIAEDRGVLVIIVQERPSISEIVLDGNKALKSEALLEGLSNSGLAEGKVFKRSTLEGMRMELTRQYVSQGRYDASIETDVIALPRNRVSVNINIDEGSTAAIKHINVVGNRVYSDKKLSEIFELQSTGWLSWMNNKDKYAREKLKADLESLESLYKDSGFVNFNIDSTQVSISPDKEGVFITVNITEGERYTVGDVELSGDLVLPEDDLNRYVLIQKGQTFSQQLLTSTEELLSRRLGNEGYNFAKVSAVPDISSNNEVVDIKFFIDPGKRTYVRRVGFVGNTRTADEVLRREMRQMEAAPANAAKIEQSRVRLERLGYFRTAELETSEVPGTDDQIDLTYTVEEQSSGSLGASLGFSQDSGLLLGANIQQNNFLGSGKAIGISVSRSQFLSSANFSYTNPYFTEDGVSRGFNIFMREADLEEVNISSFTTNSVGGAMSFGYPISEIERIGFSLGVTRTEIEEGFGAVQEIIASPRVISGVNGFITDTDDTFQSLTLAGNAATFEAALAEARGDQEGFLDIHGNTFTNASLTVSWRQSTLNRGRLATRGSSQSLSLEAVLPGSDLEYFKLVYSGQRYFPINNTFTGRLRTELGYGDGYGGTDGLPFFENFYTGGFSSVRGYKSNTIGPRSSSAVFPTLATAGNGETAYVIDSNGNLVAANVDNDADPFGGNILVEAGAELLFRLPFVKDHRSVRTALFLDMGNVYSTNCRETQLSCSDFDLSELRYSAGVGLTWITGFGPLTFSLAKALNEGEDDETEVFQFSLGTGF